MPAGAKRDAWNSEPGSGSDADPGIGGLDVPAAMLLYNSLKNELLCNITAGETRMKRTTSIVAAALLTALVSQETFAQHRHGSGDGKSGYPHIDAEIEIKFQPEWSYRSSYAPARSRRLEGEAEGNFALHLAPGFAINALAKWERVKLSDRDMSVFGGNAAFLEELNASYDTGVWSLRVGKQALGSFGRAWSEHPGIFAKDFAEDYKLSETLGVGGGAVIADHADFGRHRFDAAWFMLDNTFLSGSALSRPSRGGFLTERPSRLRLADGGAGNTRAPASWMATLNGGAFGPLPGLSYGIGHVSLKRGTARETGRAATEHRQVANLAYEMEIAKGATLTPLVEWARIRNVDFDGTDPATGVPVFGRSDYLTAQLIARWDGWAAVAGTTSRANSQPEAAGALTRDRLYHASVEYQFVNGLTLGFGWKRERQPVAIDPSGATGRLDTLGALALYVVEF